VLIEKMIQYQLLAGEHERSLMASVYVRGKKLWLRGTYNKKQYLFSSGLDNTKSNLKWLEKNKEQKFLELLTAHLHSEDNQTIFSDYGKYIIDISGGNRSEFSQREELQRFNALCKTFGSKSIEDIRATDILAWQNVCGLAPKTIKNYRSTLNVIFKYALYDGIISVNPLTVVPVPKKDYNKVIFYDKDEIKKLIASAKGQFKNILEFNFFQGLRGSELIALKWSDIDFDRNIITIQRRIREGKEALPKGEKIRVIDLLPPARKALRQQQLKTAFKEYVFVTQYGDRYSTSKVINETFKKLCQTCDLEFGTFHAVRRSCNTLLKQLDFPHDWVLDQLGHNEDLVNRVHYTGKIKPDFEKLIQF
jgi:integrase